MDGVCALGFDVQGAFLLFPTSWQAGGGVGCGWWGFGAVRVTAEFPPATQAVVHHAAGETAGVMRMHVFFGEVVDDVSRFGGGEEGGAGAVAEEAEVAVVGDDVDRGVPG